MGAVMPGHRQSSVERLSRVGRDRLGCSADLRGKDVILP